MLSNLVKALSISRARQLVFAGALVAAMALPHGLRASGTVAANTCSSSDVQSAIDRADDGDTVTIPAGKCTWLTTVVVNQKAITLQGAGMDKTILVDAVPKVSTGNPPGHMLMVHTKPGLLTRVTAMTFDGSTGITDIFNKSMLMLDGSSKSWRIDNIRFIATRTSAVSIYGFTYGVLDHSIFDFKGHRIPLYVHHNTWNGVPFGDGSWNDEMYLGTERAVFIEDNVFNGDGSALMHGLDGWSGHRVVYRYNTLNNVIISNHGTESSARMRGARSYEFYRNRISYNGANGPWPNAISIRSGNGVVFENTVTGNFSVLGSYNHYRDNMMYGIWGMCDGNSAWDVNDGVVYATGTHNGAGGQKVLSDSTKAWKSDQWVGYSVSNVTRGNSSVITSNEGNAISARSVGQTQGLPLWQSGDQYRITRASICLDQVGRGKGDLLTGSTPSPKAWPNQESEPAYAWGNTLNGAPYQMSSASPIIKDGRDYFNGTQKPGYVPYTYPHPLVAGSKGPSNVRVVNTTN
jgi:hypothetical protein